MDIYYEEYEDIIREKLIKEKEAKIKELEEELKSLKNPKSLKMLVDRQILGTRYWDKDDPEEIMHLVNWAGHDQWEFIKKLCLFLWKPRYRRDRLLIRNMDKEELEISAKMAEELIDVWNKYIVMVYGCKED